MSRRVLFIVLLLVACLSQLASDIYAPALPLIAHALGASMSLTQLSMPIYIFGVAFSQLLYGPISEGVGRKPPLVIGLIIMLAATLLCLVAPTISVLLLGRLLQGLGAGAVAALWRSIFRDVFTSAEELAKYGSYLGGWITFIIPAAPAVGGYLAHKLSWSAVFVFLLLYILMAIVLVIVGYRETSQHHHKKRLRLHFIISTFMQLLKSRVFIGYTLCAFICYGAFFAWFIVGPVVFVNRLGYSPLVFGWLSFLGGGVAILSASIINAKVVERFGSTVMLRFGWCIMFAAGVLMLLGFYLFALNVWAIIIPVLFFYFGASFVWPNTFSGAFVPFAKIAGYTGALYGALQLAGAAVIGSLVSYLPSDNQLPLAILFLLSPCIAWIIFIVMVNSGIARTTCEKHQTC